MNAMNKRAVTLLLPLIAVAVFFMLNIGSRTAAQDPKQSAPNSGRQTIQTGYALVNGLKIYYEIHGTAKPRRPPLVLLHGGGDTIGTSFGRVLPALARDRQIIAFEQQGYGHTADIVERPFSFEQSADDTAALLEYLHMVRPISLDLATAARSRCRWRSGIRESCASSWCIGAL